MTNLKTALICTLLIPGVALAQLETGNPIGTGDADIRAAVEVKGFKIIEIELDGDHNDTCDNS